MRKQILLLGLAGIILSGCTPTLPITIDEDIDYPKEITVT